MGLFGNNEERSVAPVPQGGTATNNTIGHGTTLKGDVETHGVLRMDGKIIGNLQCHSKFFLGNDGQIEGDVFAQNAEIEGEIHGRIEVAENLVLRGSAVIHGDIITKSLTIDPGAVFNGTCKMGNEKPLLTSTTSTSQETVNAVDEKEKVENGKAK
ncbi:polymer-forming cytoskeletal protein [Flammeovirga yaeyamensis]|uniref:Polymer-forming cytoskeletal protein n=1 Tax=Flammeovirga yaeyamensis TaxID=367791 RepID=A0AAX1N555_9BACT|nr:MULTISPECIES: polymer-forming cytoskeletal protein [Flammeovirga]ANQ50001.1 polymer-forming cytoskeletal protein [Flammeovirga sp. MY04]MBB3700486.1 cytoskeletal protein CcmA (bactofilin family) [Flammeovirga yaeyamensis]NMF36891.1 polymer-forming cytoskeletal protein [Flammeovirga yaeyamensis]QWG02562.1 polymer-forming cytoskeletal protein [Flammeovirga yaeyamensis]